MITERLYFADPYLTRFSARVVAREQRDQRPAVALDQSAFYPEGGGQPADTGTLSGAKVLDVQVEDGVIWHMLDQALEADLVQGAIDWARRFDHMQQHHGQHLLSAAFERLYELRTMSFHLGTGASTIDLAATELTPAQAAAAEDLTNQVIWEDRPILARFVTAEELAQLPLRKPPTVAGPVRIVSVPDFDHSACGGTHPRATGGVGLLHLRRWERRGDVTRVEFLCGGRALRDLRWKNAALGRLATVLSVGAEEGKGTDLTRETHKLLKSDVPNFIGNVEGRDLFNGNCDVVVCDGFTGNVSLKALESVVETLQLFLRQEMERSLRTRLGFLLARPAFRSFKKRVDYAEFGGAPLLGLRGCTLICHGGSSALALRNAVRAAQEYVRKGVSRRIEQRMEELIAARGEMRTNEAILGRAAGSSP